MTTLTMRDEKRLKIIQKVFQGEVTVAQGALVLGVSERQCYRIKARVKKAGAKGVVHGNRGRPCQRKIKESTVRRIVELAGGKYQDFNDHHLTEKLREEHKIKLSREMVRRILRAQGMASPHKRQGIKHRSRRERSAAEGMMLQVDGSSHDWLQGRGRCYRQSGGSAFSTGRELVGLFQVVLFDLSPTRTAPVDLLRSSLGILDRSPTHVGGAVGQQKTYHRGGPRFKGSTRGHVLQSVYMFSQNINKLLRKYDSPRLHQLMQCKELLLSRWFLREGEVLTAIAFFPHPHSLQNLSYKFFLVADIFLAQLKLHLANIGCTWNSRKVNFPHAHESRTRSRFRGLSITPHPFALRYPLSFCLHPLESDHVLASHEHSC